MGDVLFRQGNIFEGVADLTVLPCSAKGTVSSATRTWLTSFGLPHPDQLKLKLKLGELSPLIPFPEDKGLTRFVVFAASVLNDYSSFEAVEEVARKLGEITVKQPDIKIVEAPLLGTGAGRLETVISGRALYQGFRATSSRDSLLYVFAFDHHRYTELAGIEWGFEGSMPSDPMSPRTRLFISHASEDVELVTALIDLLETDLGIESSRIRCTSVPGYRLRTGSHTSAQLLNDISRADVVIGVITSESVKSSYVLLELGASWGLRRTTFPLLARGGGFDLLPGPLKENHAARLTSREDVHQVLDDLSQVMKVSRRQGIAARIGSKIESVVEAANKTT